MSPLIRFAPLALLLSAALPAQEINEKAARYYDSMQKRPAAGPVFDRFVDAWLDTGTLEQLESWLAAKAKAAPTPSAHLILGLFHVRQGAHVKAVDDYRAAIALEPGNAALWHQKALAESRLLEFDQAIASLEKGLEQKPEEALSLAMRQQLGRLLARSSRTPEALTVWQKLMEERPDDEALREDLLDLQLAEGLMEAAVQNATALVERAPDAYKKAMRRLQAADVLDRAGRTDEARKEWERCLEDSGTDSWLEKEILARLDRVFRRDDNLTGLRQHLESVIERLPQRQGLQRARVKLLAELGEKSAAVEAGRALLALAPGDRAARDEFIALLVEAGRVDEAVAQTAELVRQAPQNRDLLLRLATLKLQAGDRPGCLAAITEFDRLSGPDEAARLRSAALLERAGLVQETIDRLKAAAAEFPNSAAVSATLASALHKAKRRDEALAEWKRLAPAGGNAAILETARSLSSHGEDEAAWDLLAARTEGADFLLLNQLCLLGEKLDRCEEATPWARRMISIAAGPVELENALDLAARLIKRAGNGDDVIASIPADAGAGDLCLLTELLERRGDSAAAEETLSKAAAAAPDTAGSQLVKLYRIRQEWPKALDAGTRLFNSPGGRKAATAQMLADLAARARDLEASLQWIREWRKLSPGAAPAVLEESRILRQMGRDEEALKVLRLASGQFEESREIRQEFAQVTRDAGRTAEAFSLYAGLYEQAPDAAEKLRIVRDWAEAAAEAGRITELMEQFEERRRQNRAATGPLLALAEIHAVNGDREKQQRLLSEASLVRPDDAGLALQLAGMQEQDGQVAVAIDTLKAALPHDKSGRVRHRLARLYLAAGDHDEGMRLIEENTDGTPPDAAAVESMAISLMGNDADKAIALLQTRLTAEPDDYRLRYLLAAALADSGNYAAALKEWERLLSLTAEVPAVVARRSSPLLSAAVDARLNQMASTVPPEALAMLHIHELRVQSGGASNPFGANPSGHTAQFQLPGNLAELRALTALHLGLHAEIPEEHAAAATALLKSVRLENLRELLLPLPEYSILNDSYRPSRFTDELESLRSTNGTTGSFGMHALICLQVDDMNVGARQALRIWEEWKTSYPEFALATAIAALTDSKQPDAWEKEAVGRLTAIERPSPLILSGVARYLDRGGIAGWDSGTTHKAVLERITTWVESDWIATPALGRVRASLVEGLIKMGASVNEVPLLARVLNAEWPREEKLAAQSQSGAAGVYASSLGIPMNFGGELLGSLAWPVDAIPGVSPAFAGYSALNALDRTQSTALATTVRYPTLQALLKDTGASTGHPLPSLVQLAGTPEADAAALMLAAITSAEAEQFEPAAAFVLKALERPLRADIRRKLNATLISWAEDNMARPGSPLYLAAREAALRLRREAQTYEQKAELAAAMDNLGLNKEAAALTSAYGGMMNSYGRMNQYAAYANQQAQLRSIKQELDGITAGSEKPQFAATVKILRRTARSLLAPSGWMEPQEQPQFGGSNDEDTNWPALFKLMGEKKVRDAILGALQPADGSDARFVAVYAAALELSGDKDKAIEQYRTAAQGGDTGARVRLVKLLGPAHADSGALFIDCPPEAQARLADIMLPLGDREPLEQVLKVARLGITTAQKRDASVPVPDEWLTRLLAMLREDLPISADLRAPRLSSPGPDEPQARPARPPATAEAIAQAQQLLTERRAVHAELCGVLLRLPGAAAFAFHSLKSVSAPDNPLIEQAVAACAAESISSVPHLSSYMLQMQAIMRLAGNSAPTGLSGLAVELPHPDTLLEHILQTAVAQNAPDLIRQSLIPALQKAGATKFAEQVELLAALYFGAAEEIEGTARRLLASQGTAAWPAVIRALNQRRAAADLGPQLISELTRQRSQPELLIFMGDAAADYLAWLCREGRHEAARLLLNRVTDLLVGPARQRSTTLGGSLNGSMRSQMNFLFASSPGTAPSSAAVFTQMLKRLLQSPAAAVIALDLAYQEIIPSLSPETAASFASVLELERAPFAKSEFFADPAKAAAFFTGSPLIADITAFRSYGGAGGVFAMVANTLDSMGLEERKPVLAFLQTQPETFGCNLLIGAAGDRWGSAALNAAAPWLEQLKSLPPEGQAEIVDLLSALASGRDRLKLSPQGLELLRWIEQQQSLLLDSETVRRIEWFLNPRNSPTQSGSMFGNEVAGIATPLLTAAIKSASPRAADIVRRTSVLARGRAAETMAIVLSGEHSGPMLPLPPERSAFRLGILTSTLHTTDKRTPSFTEPVRLALPRSVRWIAEKLTGTTEEKLTALTAALTAHVKEGEAGVLLEAFPLPVTNSDTIESRAALRTAAIAWADGPGKALPRQDIVEEIVAAARLEQVIESTPGAQGITGEAALPPEQAHYLKALRNEALPPSARLVIASVLADFAGTHLEPPLIAAAATVLDRALSLRRPVEDWQRQAITQATAMSSPAPVLAEAAKALLTRLQVPNDITDPGARDETKTILRLALLTDHVSIRDRAIDRLSGEETDPDLMALLLRSGDPALIRKVTATVPHRQHTPRLVSGKVFYDDKLEAALQQALPALSEKKHQFQLEIAIHSLPSAPGQPSRLERLKAIAGRMKEYLASSNFRTRLEMIDLFTIEPGAALVFREYFNEQKKKETELSGDTPLLPEPQLHVQHERGEQTPLQRRWLLQLFAAANDGDTGAMGTMLDTAQGPARESSYYEGPSVAQQAVDFLSRGIASGWEQWDEAKRKDVEKFLRRRLEKNTLLPAESTGDELSTLPPALLEALNADSSE